MSTGFSKERVEATLERYRAFWLGENQEPMVSIYSEVNYRQLDDDDEIVKRAVACIRADGQSGRDEILPCFWPDFGTVSTAAMWGGEIIPAEGTRCIHIHPIIHRLEDLESLTPLPFEKTDFQRAYNLYKRVCGELASANVFLRLPDFQGPMNTLSLIMDQTELMCALYDDPQCIHQALNHITDTLIERVDHLMELVGRDRIIGMIWPYIGLPADLGVSITQDYMPLLNPELYRDFELPCLKRISDHFGGVFIHCCGRYAHHLENLKNSGVLIRGLETHHPQTLLNEIYRVFGNEIAYVPYVAPDGKKEFPEMSAYVDYLATTPAAKARYWFPLTCAPSEALKPHALRESIKSKLGGAKIES